MHHFHQFPSYLTYPFSCSRGCRGCVRREGNTDLSPQYLCVCLLILNRSFEFYIRFIICHFNKSTLPILPRFNECKFFCKQFGIVPGFPVQTFCFSAVFTREDIVYSPTLFGKASHSFLYPGFYYFCFSASLLLLCFLFLHIFRQTTRQDGMPRTRWRKKR